MWHENRTWGLTPLDSMEDLVRRLQEHTWTLCTAFETPGGTVWANDSTAEDAVQEYAVLRRLRRFEGQWIQVESITVSWCRELLELVRDVDPGRYDDARPLGRASEEQLEREHTPCEFCF